jgi:cyanophycinase
MNDLNKQPHRGSLLIIGGDEEREGDMQVLRRFVALSGGTDANIAVITAASEIPGEVWDMYRRAFSQLGVTNLSHVQIDARHQADNPKTLKCLAQAGGIFMSGGDQKRLLDMTGETGVHAGIANAYRQRGTCIAGTSAGASAMSRFMLAYGQADLEPAKGTTALAAGLGLVEGVVIDQHFAERQRLPRLLSIIAERPELYGVGIDQDTGLVIRPGVGIEIVGQGAITVVDGTRMMTNIGEIGKHATPRLVDVRLHVLPSGTRLRRTGAPGDVEAADGFDAAPEALQFFLSSLTD